MICISCRAGSTADDCEMCLLAAKVLKFESALEEITKLGDVCDEFEVCDHKACSSSAGAVLLALEALKDE